MKTIQSTSKFRYSSLPKYFKLATVLPINAISVYSVIRGINNDKNINSDIFGLVQVGVFFLLYIFNIWAFIMYHLTKRIQNNILLRDILFYLSLFLYPFFPFLFVTG
jgi:hypothetical protein